MKRSAIFIFCLLTLCFSAVETTASANVWAEADRLADEQKLQAALDNVTGIKKQAATSNNERLWTEALIKSAQLQIGLHGYETAVRALKSDKWPKDSSGRVILHLYYGHSLMRYHNAYSWEIQKREKTVSKNEVDLKAWTREEIGREISKTFDLVMSEGPALDQAMPDYYKPFFETNNFPPNIRPTLRDAVVYLAVEHLANTQFWTPTESNESYKLDLKRLLNAPPIQRVSAASTNHHPLFRLTSWLGEHRDFHRSRKRPEGALEAQYEIYSRLSVTFNSKDDLTVIQSSLRRTQDQNRTYPWWSRGQALLANLIQGSEKAGRLIEAREEALKGAKAYPDSIGGQMCASIVEQIEQPSYSVVSMASDAAQSRSVMIQYKNINKLFLRAYAIDFEKRVQEKKNNQDFFESDRAEEYLRSKKEIVAEWSVDLPTTRDYATHRRFTTPTIKKPGVYLIISSSKADFSGTMTWFRPLALFKQTLSQALFPKGAGKWKLACTLEVRAYRSRAPR